MAPSIAISTAFARLYPAAAGLTKAARIVAVTNRASTRQCATSRSFTSLHGHGSETREKPAPFKTPSTPEEKPLATSKSLRL